MNRKRDLASAEATGRIVKLKLRRLQVREGSRIAVAYLKRNW